MRLRIASLALLAGAAALPAGCSGKFEVRGPDEEDDVNDRVLRPLPRRRDVSVRTALVYEGHVAPIMEADGYFDAPDAQKRFESAPGEAYTRPIEGTIER